MTKTKQHDAWVPAPEAAALLGKSERQLARRVESGAIRKQVLPREPGQSAGTALFSVVDIQAILDGRPNQYEVVGVNQYAVPGALPVPPRLLLGAGSTTGVVSTSS